MQPYIAIVELVGKSMLFATVPPVRVRTTLQCTCSIPGRETVTLARAIESYTKQLSVWFSAMIVLGMKTHNQIKFNDILKFAVMVLIRQLNHVP